MRSGLRVRLLMAALLAMTAGLATALVVVAQDDSGEVTVEPGSFLPPPAPLPSLSAQQQKQVVELAMGDARVEELGAGKALKPDEPEVWTDGARNLIGGVVTLHFDAPVTAEGEWLGLDSTEESQDGSAYRLIPYTMAFKGVTALIVMVDLNVGRVVSVFPEPGAEPVGTPVIAPGVEPPSAPND